MGMSEWYRSRINLVLMYNLMDNYIEINIFKIGFGDELNYPYNITYFFLLILTFGKIFDEISSKYN